MISLLLPSRGRPASVMRLYGSAVATAAGDIELIVRLDDDDPTRTLYPKRSQIRYLHGERVTLSVYWNECYVAARGPIFMHCGDDITFNTPGWDRIVADAFPEDGIAFVHGDDLGGKGETLGTHGFLRREWVDAVGYFVPPHFSSDYNDAWLNEVADAIGRRVFVPIVTEHHHPAFGKGEWDRTHQERIARHHADDVDRIWRETKGERLRDALALLEVMQ